MESKPESDLESELESELLNAKRFTEWYFSWPDANTKQITKHLRLCGEHPLQNPDNLHELTIRAFEILCRRGNGEVLTFAKTVAVGLITDKFHGTAANIRANAFVPLQSFCDTSMTSTSKRPIVMDEELYRFYCWYIGGLISIPIWKEHVIPSVVNNLLGYVPSLSKARNPNTSFGLSISASHRYDPVSQNTLEPGGKANYKLQGDGVFTFGKGNTEGNHFNVEDLSRLSFIGVIRHIQGHGDCLIIFYLGGATQMMMNDEYCAHIVMTEKQEELTFVMRHTPRKGMHEFQKVLRTTFTLTRFK
jgi:hypothetical protein